MYRKLIIVAGIGSILFIAGLPSIVAWLDRAGLIEIAAWARVEFLTGTAITVIVALMILLPTEGGLQRYTRSYHCPVCDERLRHHCRYCHTCGSRVVTKRI